MLGKTSWYSIDVSVNDRHILLFYKKCHFCHLLPFAKVGQYSASTLLLKFNDLWPLQGAMYITPENVSFMQFSQKIDGFRQKDSQGF